MTPPDKVPADGMKLCHCGSAPTEPAGAAAVLGWMRQAVERGEDLQRQLKHATPDFVQEALLASTRRLLEKCREEVCVLEAGGHADRNGGGPA